MSSLRPVHGSPREVYALLRAWDTASVEPEPLTIETSGSTGEPKRVLLSRGAMRASAEATHARLGGPGQWLLALPAGYVAGAQVLFRSVRAGTEPVFADDHENIAVAVETMEGERRYTSLVPTQLARTLGSPRDVAALRGLDAILLGGAAMEPALRTAALEAGLSIVATYGMSETCGGCVYDGVALDGAAVALSADGRVRVTGPMLFDGYDGQPDLTAEVMQDGWLITQDLGRLDEDGRLQVLGRVDDVVVSGGVNVPTPAVAARLEEHEGIVAAEVVGVPDEEWGQRVVAVVVPGGQPAELGELRDFVSEGLPRPWAPREVVTVEAIPLLSNGKVDRQAVARIAAGDRP